MLWQHFYRAQIFDSNSKHRERGIDAPGQSSDVRKISPTTNRFDLLMGLLGRISTKSPTVHLLVSSCAAYFVVCRIRFWYNLWGTIVSTAMTAVLGALVETTLPCKRRQYAGLTLSSDDDPDRIICDSLALKKTSTKFWVLQGGWALLHCRHPPADAVPSVQVF